MNEYKNVTYFCSSKIRPDCLRNKLKNNSGEMSSLCCLHCNIIEKCQDQNKSKTKPCTLDIVGADEYCPYGI